MKDRKRTAANTFLCLSNILSTITGTIKIEKLTVPKFVEVGSSAELNCEYSAMSRQFSVRWFFNENTEPLSEWNPGEEPKISKFLDKRLNLPLLSNEKRQTLKLINLSTELSGSYTCSISSHIDPDESRLTQTMVVYSPVQDFELNLDHQHQYTTVTCIARGLFPKPDLTIEYNNEVVRQGQHVWQREGRIYDVKSTALIQLPASCLRAAVVCRLQLPQVDYTAFKKKLVTNAEKSCKNKSSRIKLNLEAVLISISLRISLPIR